MTTKPITPAEAISQKRACPPDCVMEAFNELIVANFDGRFAIFTKAAVVNLISKKTTVAIDEIYEWRWLEVEKFYRDAGWIVVCDNPGFYEYGEATFNFKRKEP